MPDDAKGLDLDRIESDVEIEKWPTLGDVRLLVRAARQRRAMVEVLMEMGAAEMDGTYRGAVLSGMAARDIIRRALAAGGTDA